MKKKRYKKNEIKCRILGVQLKKDRHGKSTVLPALTSIYSIILQIVQRKVWIRKG
jgi:predicted ATPase